MSDGQGHFLSPGHNEVIVGPFLKENEARKLQDFESKFELSITDTTGEERYKGETAPAMPVISDDGRPGHV